MRDTGRIYNFCNKLANIWSDKSSDLRFGQLMSNVFDEIKNEGKNPFYLEENEMLKYVEDYLNSVETGMKRNLQLDEWNQFDGSNKDVENGFNK